MALLRKSTKLSTQEPACIKLESTLLSTGCFDISPEGTPAYNPDLQKVEPVVEEEKVDHRPKEWYDQQCKFENYIKGIVLNSAPLNEKKGSKNV